MVLGKAACNPPVASPVPRRHIRTRLRSGTPHKTPAASPPLLPPHAPAPTHRRAPPLGRRRRAARQLRARGLRVLRPHPDLPPLRRPQVHRGGAGARRDVHRPAAGRQGGLSGPRRRVSPRGRPLLEAVRPPGGGGSGAGRQRRHAPDRGGKRGAPRHPPAQLQAPLQFDARRPPPRPRPEGRGHGGGCHRGGGAAPRPRR